MVIYNTIDIIYNSVKIMNNHKIVHYSKHIGNGQYMDCVKAIPFEIDLGIEVV